MVPICQVPYAEMDFYELEEKDENGAATVVRPFANPKILAQDGMVFRGSTEFQMERKQEEDSNG